MDTSSCHTHSHENAVSVHKNMKFTQVFRWMFIIS